MKELLMEIDLSDIAKEAAERKKDKLNTLVAITIALLATFTGICKVKDDNIVQAMQQAQADRVDHWSWYQSLHVREEVAGDALANLNLQKAIGIAEHQAAYDTAITEAKEKLERVTAHKEEVSSQAKDDQKKYDYLNYRDDQFDLSDVMMALAISLLAVTSLVQKHWLYGIAMIPSFFGIIMGLAGLMGWQIHPDTIIQLLS